MDHLVLATGVTALAIVGAYFFLQKTRTKLAQETCPPQFTSQRKVHLPKTLVWSIFVNKENDQDAWFSINRLKDALFQGDMEIYYDAEEKEIELKQCSSYGKLVVSKQKAEMKEGVYVIGMYSGGIVYIKRAGQTVFEATPGVTNSSRMQGPFRYLEVSSNLNFISS